MNSFTIPHQLPTLNEYINKERINRFAGAKVKKDNTELCALYAKKLNVEKDKQYNVHCMWTTKDKKTDSDNVYFAIKFILDGIVQAERLNGDGYKQIKNIYHEREIGDNVGVKVTLIESM